MILMKNFNYILMTKFKIIYKICMILFLFILYRYLYIITLILHYFVEDKILIT